MLRSRFYLKRCFARLSLAKTIWSIGGKVTTLLSYMQHLSDDKIGNVYGVYLVIIFQNSS